MTVKHPARRLLAIAGGLFTLSSSLLAGVDESATQDASASKDVAAQAAAQSDFPVHFSLTVGGEDQFIFRGVNILPQVLVNPTKAYTEAINALPKNSEFRSLLAAANTTPKQFVEGVGFPNTGVRLAQNSGLVYADGNVSAYGFTLGAFYGTQTNDRVKNKFFGADPIFDEYHEFDAYLSYSHSFGPVTLTLGGTFYHVINNSDFDTAELNFGVAYTPPKFRYVTASFSYDYAGAFAYQPEYLDGNHLEFRISGYVPVYKHAITFNPYVLLSMGSGIVPRAFNPLSLPTYFSTKRYAAGIAGPILQAAINGQNNVTTSQVQDAVAQAFNPADLDRGFDLSNFQTGFKVPVYLTRLLTLTGDANFSHPLGNLRGGYYNQKDEFWAGLSLNVTY
jgi:hypothetical protein